eukprot:TRINITY_DN110172_c0_g1_i1.p1 TRINITY_DN110172_c0_g1~~TRINITY_DN110172_c0_g1_i1.p1  ORF type:complete len:178 (+),score=26.51 TRINITY_DN110172_c0_g1_i1:23-535(+)
MLMDEPRSPLSRAHSKLLQAASFEQKTTKAAAPSSRSKSPLSLAHDADVDTSRLRQISTTSEGALLPVDSPSARRRRLSPLSMAHAKAKVTLQPGLTPRDRAPQGDGEAEAPASPLTLAHSRIRSSQQLVTTPTSQKPVMERMSPRTAGHTPRSLCSIEASGFNLLTAGV